MKIYMKNAGIMNTSNRGFSSNLGAVPLDAKKQDKSYASVGEYLDKTKQSRQDKVKVEYIDYKCKSYSQKKQSKFFNNLSIIDLIFNHGKQSIKFI